MDFGTCNWILLFILYHQNDMNNGKYQRTISILRETGPKPRSIKFHVPIPKFETKYKLISIGVLNWLTSKKVDQLSNVWEPNCLEDDDFL